MKHDINAAIIAVLLSACNASSGGAQDDGVSQGVIPGDTSTVGQTPSMPGAASGAAPSSGGADADSAGQAAGNGSPVNGAGLGSTAPLPTAQATEDDPLTGEPGPEMPPTPMPTPEVDPDPPVDEPPTGDPDPETTDVEGAEGVGGMGPAPNDMDAASPNDPSESEGLPAQTSETCEDGPLELPVEGCAPEFEETGDFYEDCVARINQLRWECQCLPPLERWVEAESCADAQAEYDYEVDEAHAGISNGICEPGGGSQNECPDYGERFGIIDYCLQQMWDEGPGEDFQAHGHYINMSSTTVNKVACGRFETPDGSIWSVQNFSR